MLVAATVLAAVPLGVLALGQDERAASPAVDRPSPPVEVSPPGPALVERLFGFADGTGRFPGDSEVRFYSNGWFWNSLSGSQAEDRDLYSLCSGLGPDQCAASYLHGLRAARGYQVVTRLPDACGPSNRLVGPRRGTGARTVFAVWAGPGPCGVASAIQIRYDAPDQVRAVNQIDFVVDDPHDDLAVADRFIAFARGTRDGFPVGTALRLYQDGTPVRTLSAVEARQRASYRDCGDEHCAFSAVRRIRGVAEKPALRRSPRVPACLLRRSPALPTAGTGGSRSLLVSDVDAPCAWGVRLWLDDAGRIVAIDLLRPGAD
ncbi:hypothetical protein EFK50_07465 [Nocardioides marmoriginsengisoli]|uniref:Uncharacterized protein n=1 Tax=Nocardioides marmoriginsengisoli TaxID=661483 RepID=A0A3N0CLM5_9ACTN|nr:hypothetical protein [Nocardioides marmoriginsengisoli]RNL64357.1 hypothetical protein EFK50_07465 [Nocardioides marmoriginsengisoli]